MRPRTVQRETDRRLRAGRMICKLVPTTTTRWRHRRQQATTTIGQQATRVCRLDARERKRGAEEGGGHIGAEEMFDLSN